MPGIRPGPKASVGAVGPWSRPTCARCNVATKVCDGILRELGYRAACELTSIDQGIIFKYQNIAQPSRTNVLQHPHVGC